MKKGSYHIRSSTAKYGLICLITAWRFKLYPWITTVFFFFPTLPLCTSLYASDKMPDSLKRFIQATREFFKNGRKDPRNFEERHPEAFLERFEQPLPLAASSMSYTMLRNFSSSPKTLATGIWRLTTEELIQVPESLSKSIAPFSLLLLRCPFLDNPLFLFSFLDLTDFSGATSRDFRCYRLRSIASDWTPFQLIASRLSRTCWRLVSHSKGLQPLVFQTNQFL